MIISQISSRIEVVYVHIERLQFHWLLEFLISISWNQKTVFFTQCNLGQDEFREYMD